MAYWSEWTFGEVVVSPVGNDWRVARSLPPGWPPVTMWRTDDREEALEVARSVLDHREVAKALGRDSGRTEERATHVEGVTSRVSRTGYGARVALRRGGKDVMEYMCGPCDWRTAYIAGEPCASGSALGLPEDLRGRGLGRHAYDEAQRMLGIPLVPHCANMNVGMLSDEAQAFWAKRIAAVGAPGFDRAAAERRARAYECSTSSSDRPEATDDAGFAIAVASALDLKVEWIVSGTERRMEAAWCLLPGGKVALPVGQVSRRAATRHVVGEDPGHYVRSTGRPETLAALVKANDDRQVEMAGQWRDAFADSHVGRASASARKASAFLHELDPGRWPAPPANGRVAEDDLAVTLAAEAERLGVERMEPCLQ